MEELIQDGNATDGPRPRPRWLSAASSGPLSAERRIAELEADLHNHREYLGRTLYLLHSVHASIACKLANRFHRALVLVCPKGSWRRATGAVLLRLFVQAGQALEKLATKLRPRSINTGYRSWIAKNEPGPGELLKQRQTRWPSEPLIAIVVNVCDPPRRLLAAMVQSVIDQSYAHWTLCLVDGGSRNAAVREMLASAARQDSRIKVLDRRQDYALAANAALAATTGDYVAFLDQVDTLAPFALFEVVRAIHQGAGADFIYSDEDCLKGAGSKRSDAHFKPDWSPDTLRSHNYVGQLAVFRRDLLQRLGGIRAGYEGSRNYDLILRATESARAIVHIPKVLYHRRLQRGKKTAMGDQASIKSLQEHLERSGLVGAVQAGKGPQTFRITYQLPALPLVSIVIPNKDHADMLRRCLASVCSSSYPNLEILLVENHSKQPETFAYYRELVKDQRVRLLTWEEPFNYAAVNNLAARQARGDVLLFLNNDVCAINADWLERMVEHAVRKQVGAVGAKLYYPDDTIQHAGAILGMGWGAAHYQRFFPRHSSGYCNRLVCVQNLSVVTGACLMTRREVFEEVGGFDQQFALLYNDMDLCLKLQAKGYLVIWTPHAELYHFECTTRGHDDQPDRQARASYESMLFQWRWAELLAKGDPYYNANLTLSAGDCTLRR